MNSPIDARIDTRSNRDGRPAAIDRQSMLAPRLDLNPHFAELRKKRNVHSGVVVLVGVALMTHAFKLRQITQRHSVQCLHRRFLANLGGLSTSRA
jgi:hypothetical protein